MVKRSKGLRSKSTEPKYYLVNIDSINVEVYDALIVVSAIPKWFSIGNKNLNIESILKKLDKS
jgi:hypothetical protein